MSTEYDKLRTTLAPDTDFEGELEYSSPLKIQGKFKGKIGTDSLLWIDEPAFVEADVNARSVRLGGVLKGSINAKELVELLSTAKLYGNIKTARLKIADGVVFEGNCEMIS